MRPDADHAWRLARALWHDLDGDEAALERVRIDGPAGVLPSIFDVTGFAAATVSCAAVAVAELAAARAGRDRPDRAVRVDRLAASASFKFETLVRAIGWTIPPIWDPVAGDYRASDGWIRLHTNYRHHLDAALRVLGCVAQRDAVSAAVARWSADKLEAAVVAAGGCAAAMRTSAAWERHPAGEATRDERPVVLRPGVASPSPAPGLGQEDGAPPLAGIRILDLTRVIAGPVCTRYLAAYGADVLRVDPPGFAEVPALLPEATAGKRCAFLDLGKADDRRRFEALVARAHVVVGGLRPDALSRLGYGPDALRAINPALVGVAHDAYGWRGPWAQRRGFDSLVQMSTGIAAAGMRAARADRPTPLPAQALDHGIGHLLAAGACRALTALVREGVVRDVRGSLLGAANVIKGTTAPAAAATDITVDDAPRARADTAFGPVERVPLAGTIAGLAPRWSQTAGPLGRHEATF